MKRIACLVLGLAAAWALASCSGPSGTAPAGNGGAAREDARVPPAASPFAPGPYAVGRTWMVAIDAGRNKRRLAMTIWYPATVGGGAAAGGGTVVDKATPERGGGPYPLIVSSTTAAMRFAPHVVSHGFVWAGVDRLGSYPAMSLEMVDQPLDILFALNQAASEPPTELKGLIDADHAGAMGYSFDGYNALALSGARIDPAYYLAQCPEPDATTGSLNLGMSAFSCDPATAWDAFVKGAGKAGSANRKDLWRPMTDKRIRAVMPLACEGWWLFGERGLAAVDRPTLMIVATDDELYGENTLIYEHLGTADKALISVVGKDHYMVFDDQQAARMAGFAVAFFGVHLQGWQEFARYVSQDYVSQQAGLVWGPYTK